MALYKFRIIIIISSSSKNVRFIDDDSIQNFGFTRHVNHIWKGRAVFLCKNRWKEIVENLNHVTSPRHYLPCTVLKWTNSGSTTTFLSDVSIKGFTSVFIFRASLLSKLYLVRFTSLLAIFEAFTYLKLVTSNVLGQKPEFVAHTCKTQLISSEQFRCNRFQCQHGMKHRYKT